MKYRIVFDYALDCYCAEKKGWFRWSYVEGTLGDTAAKAEENLRSGRAPAPPIGKLIVTEFEV